MTPPALLNTPSCLNHVFTSVQFNSKILRKKVYQKSKLQENLFTWWVYALATYYGPHKNIYFGVSCILGQITKK